MITQLTLENFKSFKNATLDLGPFSVVVGANAAGKSNIRDALRFLHGVGRGYSLAEIIGGKYGSGGQAEWSGVRGSAAELIRFGEQKFSLQVSLTAGRNRFRYLIEIAADPTARTGFRVVQESLVVGYNRTVFTSHPGGVDPVDLQDDDAHLLLRMEKTGEQRKYGLRVAVRDDQPALTQLLDEKRVVRAHKDLISIFLEEIASIRFLDLVPDLMRQPAFPGQLILGDNGENLSTVLQSICIDPKRERVLYDWIKELTPLDVKSLKFIKDQVTGLIQFAIEEESGNTVSSYSASDGTLRFLAMLAALLGDEPARFYFFEEIDNGIHPARLKLLIDLIESVTSLGYTQVLTTTHSPELVSMVSRETFDRMAVVYRLPHKDYAQVKRATDMPRLNKLKDSQGINRLLTGGWFEDILEFDDVEGFDQ